MSKTYDRQTAYDTLLKKKEYLTADEMNERIQTLDQAELVPLFYQLPGSMFGDDNAFINEDGKEYYRGENYQIPGQFGIINKKSCNIVNTVSSRYHLVQHKEIFSTILNALEHAGLEDPLYHIENDGDLVRLEGMFNSYKLHDDSKSGIIPGFRFIHGYDNTAIKGEFYGMRLVCLNGMTSSQLVKDHSFSIRHLSNVGKADEMIGTFINNILSSIELIEDTVSDAMDIELKFDNMELMSEFLEPILGQKQMATKLAYKLPLETTRYNVYNAITEYATHGDVTRVARDKILRNAEKVLIGDPVHFSAEIVEVY
jgi:hypothetical protein